MFFEDHRLGRHVYHDLRSVNYREELPRKTTPLRTVQHRRYDPRPEPNQDIGCCTMVAECMMANTKGNRVRGKVLNMQDAEEGYSLATQLDPWEGSYPPNDTGSSGLAAAKAAVQLGIATDYVWYFSVEEVLQALQLHPVSFGGIWTWDMFNCTQDHPVIYPTGEIAGGHQWLLSGYLANDHMIAGECWWGPVFGRNGRFYISVDDFRTLMEQDGDAHYTRRKNPNG
jgi:hypothetical protein